MECAAKFGVTLSPKDGAVLIFLRLHTSLLSSSSHSSGKGIHEYAIRKSSVNTGE